MELEATATADESFLDKDEKTPEDWAKHWTLELKAAMKEVKPWHADAAEATRAFLCEKNKDLDLRPTGLFTSNVQTMEAILFGRTPHTDVSRKFGDAMDDLARVGAEIMERNLNGDMEDGPHGGTAELRNALKDRLVAGFAMARLRYVMEEEKQDIPAMHKTDEAGQPVVDEATGKPIELAPAFQDTVKTYECVETLHVHWKDVLWSPARTFEEWRWCAFKEPMTRKEQVARFGNLGKLTPLNTKRAGKSAGEDLKDNSPLAKSDVWEIWDKEHKKVFWWVEGFVRILDVKDDLLGLDNFWPFARPHVGVMSTDKYLPTTDYAIAKQLYQQCDELVARLSELESSIGVKGVYSNELGDELKRMVEERGNKLYAVANWAMLGEKGGLKGVIDWYPLDQIAVAITQLKQALTDKMSFLFQVTGMSDIMRGQAQAQTTATEQAIKAKFASVRVQSMQDENARFVSDTQRIKAEIICKHFDDATIIQRSNIMNTADAQLAAPAVQLLKSKWSTWRIEVKPEAVSLTDYAALKQERMEVLTALGGFFQSVVPMVQLVGAGVMPFVLQVAQWLLAGVKGSSTMEGLFDQAIEQSKQLAQQQAAQPQQQKPDPRLQTEQFKAQAQQQHTMMELQADLARTKAETASQMQVKEHDALTNVKEAEAQERMKAMHQIQQLHTPGGQPA